MTSGLRTSIASAAVFAGIGALVITTPAMGAQLQAATVSTAKISSLVTPFELLSKSESKGQGASYSDDESDDNHHYGDGHSDDDEGGIGGVGNFVADFLAANQAQVLAVTAMIPVFYVGPVAVGNSLLATAYYDGYNGSAPGLQGVVSYVTSQFGVPPTDIVQGLVLGLTSLVPQFNIGPVAVGNSLLATAYFDGFNGSATGLAGVIAYVTSQLGLQALPGAAVSVSPVPVRPAAAVAVSRVAVAAPAAAQDRNEKTTAADAVEVSASAHDAEIFAGSAGESKDAAPAGRSKAVRGATSAKAGSAHTGARAERSVAKVASSDD